MRVIRNLCFVLLIGFSLVGSDRAAAGGKFMVGAKIYEYKGDVSSLVAEWKRVGINTAFLSADLAAKPDLMALARKNGIATFIILPVFQNPERLAAHPEESAATGRGKRAEDDWVKFVCPTREAYRTERLEYVRHLITSCNPDGLSIDFIRYFVFWEKVYPDARPDPLDYACFCPVCLEKFQSDARLAIPPELDTVSRRAEWILRERRQAWVSWKCRIITSMVAAIAAEAHRVKPGILLNVHLVPWRENDFNQAAQSIAGQDVEALAPLVDYLSPMCYAHMVKQDAAWIGSVAQDIGRRVNKPVIPSVQVKQAYLPEKLTSDEFRRYLDEVRKPPSAGVIFWNWPMLEQDAEKADLVRSMKRR
jgi:hypothetical protein